MEETILSTIRNEHAEIMDLMILVEEAQQLTMKEEFYSSLKSKLMEHMEGEDLTIYKRLREDVEEVEDIEDKRVGELIKKSNLEHHKIREYLQRLNRLNMDGVEWKKIFLELKDIVKKHCEREEKEMFSEAKEDFSREELTEMASEFENNKRTTNLNFIF